MAKAYFVCHIGLIFQISLIYAFIGCPQSVGLCEEGSFFSPFLFCCCIHRRPRHASSVAPNLFQLRAIMGSNDFRKSILIIMPLYFHIYNVQSIFTSKKHKQICLVKMQANRNYSIFQMSFLGMNIKAEVKVIHPKYYKHLKKAAQHSHLDK